MPRPQSPSIAQDTRRRTSGSTAGNCRERTYSLIGAMRVGSGPAPTPDREVLPVECATLERLIAESIASVKMVLCLVSFLGMLAEAQAAVRVQR